MGVKRRNKVTAFNQEAQDARCGDSGTSVDKQRASLYFDLTDQYVGGMVRRGCQSYGHWILKDGRLRRNDRP